MSITDPIADMLTRIRNANTANHKTVDVPASRTKHAIAQILADEGFIESFERRSEGPQSTIRIALRYGRRRRRSSPACGASRDPVCASTRAKPRYRACWAGSAW